MRQNKGQDEQPGVIAHADNLSNNKTDHPHINQGQSQSQSPKGKDTDKSGQDKDPDVVDKNRQGSDTGQELNTLDIFKGFR